MPRTLHLGQIGSAQILVDFPKLAIEIDGGGPLRRGFSLFVTPTTKGLQYSGPIIDDLA